MVDLDDGKESIVGDSGSHRLKGTASSRDADDTQHLIWDSNGRSVELEQLKIRCGATPRITHSHKSPIYDLSVLDYGRPNSWSVFPRVKVLYTKELPEELP